MTGNKAESRLNPDYERKRGSSVARAFAVEPFVPRARMRGGHMQTIVSHFLRRENRLPAPEKRLVRVADEAQVLCHNNWQAAKSTSPTLVIVHGLEGSSDSQYVIGTANKAVAAGMNVVRMNVRNCGGTEAYAPTLYHSGMSGDIGEVVRHLIEQDSLRTVFLAGFSMGGNQVLKLAGEWGANAPAEVAGVVAISPAMDLSASADALHQRNNRLYEVRFLLSLRARLLRKEKLFPGRFVNGKTWWASVREFDDLVTAGHSGFASADDYYTRASAARVLEHIRVPTLIINSADDPFIRVTGATRATLDANQSIHYVETAHGGHCGFMAQPDRTGYDGRWAERQIVRFCLHCAGAR